MQPGGGSVERPRKTRQGIHVGQQSELSSTRIVVILNNLQSVEFLIFPKLNIDFARKAGRATMFGLLLESICQPNQNGFGIRRSKERNPNRKPAREAGGDGDIRIAGNGGRGPKAPPGKRPIHEVPRPPPAPPWRGHTARV